MQFNIVTPSYNQDRFLIKTITSVLKQKGDFKINYWVMDADSTDNSKKIFKIFKNKINFISKKDKGQSDAINKGIKRINKKTKNNIFAFINSDDYYLPRSFAKVQEAFLENPDKMWLVGDCKIVNEKNKEIQTLIKFYKKILRFLPTSWILTVLNPIAQPAVFIRLEAIKNIGLFNTKLNFVMDYEYWFRLLEEYGEPIKLSDELAAFRIHKKSKGGTEFIKQFDEELKIASKFAKYPLLLTLHKWHNNMITNIYKIIK